MMNLGFPKRKLTESEWVWKSTGFRIWKKNCRNLVPFRFELHHIPRTGRHLVMLIFAGNW